MMNIVFKKRDTIHVGGDTMNNKLAPHEAIEIRELLSQEVLGIKKTSSSINMVTDTELKSFMQDSVNARKTAIQNIETAVGRDIGTR